MVDKADFHCYGDVGRWNYDQTVISDGEGMAVSEAMANLCEAESGACRAHGRAFSKAMPAVESRA